MINEKDNTIGIIDFGDAVFSFQVAEAAIALAYIYMETQELNEKYFHFLSGYHLSFKLNEYELRSIPYLMCIRLCISVVMSSWRKILFPDNKYLIISEESGWSALKQLSKIKLSSLSAKIIKNVQ